MVRLAGVGSNSPLAHIPALLYEGDDDTYEVAKKLGWKHYDELNEIARDGVELPDGTT
jgi:hypothetical protein